MQIDEHVEEAVREAYRAVIAKDGPRLVNAFRDLSEDDARTAVAYGLFVCGFVVKDVLRDGITEQNLDQLAAAIIASESAWVDLGSAEDLAALLRAAATGDTSFAEVRDRQDVVGKIFVCGGYLLTSYRRDDQHWWDYLDEIWAALEAAPEA
jgi:hypothetical protein